MDQLKKIAKEFYEAFEGLQLYPKLFSWQWLLLLLSGIGAALCYYRFQTHPQGVSDYFWMPTVALGVGAIASIIDYKTKALTTKYARFPSIDAARISKLKELLGKNPCEFSEAAQDLMQLVELSKKCGKQPLSTRDLFSIPWPKGEFLMCALAVAALVFTTLGVLFPDAAKELGQTILSHYIGDLILSFFAVIFLGLTAVPIARALWHNFKRWLGMWQARLQNGPVSTRVHVDYLLEHLVRLHEPHPMLPQQRRPTIKRSPPRLRRLK